jgi:hypothetical protein
MEEIDAAMLRARHAFADPFEASLRWTEEPGDASAFGGERSSGYEVATRVTADATLGEPQFFTGRPVAGLGSESCPDWFQLPATVELATEDGALAGTAEGYINGMSLTARVNLADVVGTMDLHLNPDLEFRAELYLRVRAYPEGKRGQLDFTVYEGVGHESGYWPITAEFPDDGCASSGFPASADTPLAWLGGQSAAAYLASWRTELSSLLVEAVQGDCAPDAYSENAVELRFDLGSPETDICQFSSWPEDGRSGTLTFNSASRLTTSDGQIDMPLSAGPMPVSGGMLSASWENGMLLSDGVGFYDFSERLPAEQFAAQLGIHGVDARNSVSLKSELQAGFSRSSGAILSGGSLRVEGMDCPSPGQCYLSTYKRIVWPLDATSLATVGAATTKDWLCP